MEGGSGPRAFVPLLHVSPVGLIGDGILLELEAEAVVGCGKLPAVVFE